MQRFRFSALALSARISCRTASICFVGVGRFLEIWDEARFDAFCRKSEADLGSLMDYVNERYFKPAEDGRAF